MPLPRIVLETQSGRRFVHLSEPPPPGVQATLTSDDGWLCPMNAANAAALRTALPWTAPMPVGLQKSVGCGDRLGCATPGHLRAVLEGDMFPVLAQQSIRENDRTRRSPQEVIDDATWGVFVADYRTGYGSDADHLKTTSAIDICVDAGFSGFTLDPGDHVDNAAHTDDLNTLKVKYTSLPWEALNTSPEAFLDRYTGDSIVGPIDATAVYRTACKYGAAIAHAATLARHIHARMMGRPYDLEVSVDETDTPTSPIEHLLIASELRRLGVPFHGLAPRFVGRFEKGVDYIGDLEAFEREFTVHGCIAREYGPYKLSIHSGSDKFSIYGLIARHANPYVHLKTAGTSWLEACRVIAMHDPTLLREMLQFALDRYPTDRLSYHVSAECDRVPTQLSDADLPALLDQFDARQIMHVTYGSLLDTFGPRFSTGLYTHLNTYYDVLHIHFNRHIQPFKEA